MLCLILGHKKPDRTIKLYKREGRRFVYYANGHTCRRCGKLIVELLPPSCVWQPVGIPQWLMTSDPSVECNTSYYSMNVQRGKRPEPRGEKAIN